MPVITVDLSAEENASLDDIAHSLGQTPAAFVKRAIKMAIVNADPDRQGPISVIRSATYPRAMGPFDIIEAPRGSVLARPIELTRAALLHLQEKGIDFVNIRFHHDGAVREPDYSIKELLG